MTSKYKEDLLSIKYPIFIKLNQSVKDNPLETFKIEDQDQDEDQALELQM